MKTKAKKPRKRKPNGVVRFDVAVYTIMGQPVMKRSFRVSTDLPPAAFEMTSFCIAASVRDVKPIKRRRKKRSKG